MSDSPILRASRSTVATLFADQARQYPDRVALQDAEGTLSYRLLLERVARLAGTLRMRGVVRGERIALLSENRREYIEVLLAAASVGAAVACQNWRLASAELRHCLTLVEPKLVFVSQRHQDPLDQLDLPFERIVFGREYEAALESSAPVAVDASVDPEDPLLILYTSGTTGSPKGALISHRAELWRGLVMRADLGIAATDAFVAWSPLYHMGAADPSLLALTSGGKVIVVDGFDKTRLAQLVADERLGWLLLMPGMVGSFADELEARAVRPRGVKLCGVMADLVPPHELSRITRLLDAPYANTFGATETGCPPCSASLLPVGITPSRLSKEKSPFCEIKLVDTDDREVPAGTPGQLCMRGPTLFSGYFRAEEVNAEEFRGGWFHMGDIFRQNPDGSFEFVDRVKYLIKSGGENVYPAEVERVIATDPRVLDVAVVKSMDERWGEVPVAFVARNDESLTEREVRERCQAELARYKAPKAVHFIEMSDFPRSASGKIQRHLLEARLEANTAPT